MLHVQQYVERWECRQYARGLARAQEHANRDMMQVYMADPRVHARRGL